MTHRFDQRLSGTLVDLFAEPANVNFDQLCVVIVSPFPNTLAQLHSRKSATRFAHQDLQKSTFALRQLDATLATPHLAFLDVQCHISSAKNFVRRRDKAATQRVNPGEKFVHREWFREVVIRSTGKAGDLVWVLTSGSQHQDSG